MRWTALPQSDDVIEPIVVRSRRACLIRKCITPVIFLTCVALLGYLSRPRQFKEVNDDLEQNSTAVQEHETSKWDGLTGEQSFYQRPSKMFLSPQARILMTEVERNCPNWGSAFTSSYENSCGFWLDSYIKWLGKTANKRPVGYACLDEKECRGLGDRLAGIQGAFSTAMESDRPLKIMWTGLDRLFESCLFRNKTATAWGRGLPEAPSGCIHKNRGDCAGRFIEAQTCHGKPVWFENSDRACLTEDMCAIGQQAFPDTLDPVGMYGCGLRALMEPTQELNDYKISFRDAANGLRKMTLLEAQQHMSKYFIISIHFRIGDAAAFTSPGSHEVFPENHNYLRPFQCASTIQSYLEQRPFDPSRFRIVTNKDLRYVFDRGDDEFKVNGRPVRWFLASDSNSIRDMAVQLFGEKLFMIDTRPAHLAFVTGNRGSILADTFAEWYLLGKGDIMVLNRIGGPSLYNGRMSSFSKTAWIYHLKSIVYDAGPCRRRQLLLDGTWKVAPRTCQKSKVLRYRFSQPHLANLQTTMGNISFPQVWLDRGVLSVFDASLASTTPSPEHDRAGEDESQQTENDDN